MPSYVCHALPSTYRGVCYITSHINSTHGLCYPRQSVRRPSNISLSTHFEHEYRRLTHHLHHIPFSPQSSSPAILNGCQSNRVVCRRDVTFLYKLQAGVCSKSYGMNVAALAGVPADVRTCHGYHLIIRAVIVVKSFPSSRLLL